MYDYSIFVVGGFNAFVVGKEVSRKFGSGDGFVG